LATKLQTATAVPLSTDALKSLVAMLAELEAEGLPVSADLESPVVFLQSRRGKAVLDLSIHQQMQGMPDEVIKEEMARAFARYTESDRLAREHVIASARRLRVLLKRELAKVPLTQSKPNTETWNPRRAKGA
jgi:hypothetical protein